MHFRILHVDSKGDRYDQLRFNNEGLDGSWTGPWVSSIPPSLVQGNNEVVLSIEAETWQVYFNGERVNLAGTMPVLYQRLRDASQILLELKDNHLEFLDGLTILTPTVKTGKFSPIYQL